jgi:hypothetical protein
MNKLLFFDRLEAIDDFIKKGPESTNYIHDIKPLLLEEASIKYFYDNIKDPKWLTVLDKAGVFNNPPSKIIKGKYTHFPVWLEANYLKTISTNQDNEIQTQTYNIISRISNDNDLVHSDFIDIANNLDAGLAAKIAMAETKWINNKDYLYVYLTKKLFKFIEKLLKYNKCSEAIELTKAILRPLPLGVLNEDELEDKNGELYYKYNNIHSKCDSWEYEEFINNIVPLLTDACKIEALKLFCDLAKEAIALKHNTDDSSFIWRPTIEGPGSGAPEDITDLLISAVRDSAEILLKDDHIEVYELLEKQYSIIFKRVALYLRNKYFGMDQIRTENIIMNWDTFNEINYKNEYYHLLKNNYPALSGATKQKYLDFAKSTEERPKWYSRFKENKGTEPTEEEINIIARRWKYEKLLPIADYLNGELKEQFDDFKKEFGHIDPIGRGFTMGPVMYGPNSPINIEQLKAYTVDDLVSYLNNWQPNGGKLFESPEGLGRNLSAIVSTEPERYAESTDKLIGIEPTYIRSILYGFQQAASKNINFNWLKVLTLCDWVLKQKIESEVSTAKIPLERDADWNPSRMAVARLLDAGFDAGNYKIPLELKDNAWKLLEILSKDINPSEEYENTYGGKNLDALTMSINTTRGIAMHAVVKYAIWVYRDLETKKELKDDIFVFIPEVKRVLDKHLDKKYDPSLAVHSVYGQWIPWFVLFSKVWLNDALPLIFPQEPEKKTYRDVAWETYISLNAPYDNVFELLSNEYGNAIKDLNKPAEDRSHFGNIKESLAKHIINYFWRDRIKLDEKNNLLKLLCENSDIELRKFIIGYLGRGLEGNDSIDPKVIDKLKEFVQYRFDEIYATKNTEMFMEFFDFGLWFYSNKIDDNWTIKQLKVILEKIGELRFEEKVVKYMVQLAKSNRLLGDILDCIEYMIKQEKEMWKFLGWKDDVKEILTMSIEIPEHKSKAINIVHKLGAIGLFEFRDLLKSES